MEKKTFYQASLWLSVVTLMSLPIAAHSAPTPMATLAPVKSQAKLPPGLKWKSEKLQVVSRVRGNKLRTYAVLRGFYQQKGWQLKINKKERLRMSKDQGRFALAVRLEGNKTPVMVNAIGPKGEKITYHAQVIFDGYDQYQLSHSPDKVMSPNKKESEAKKNKSSARSSARSSERSKDKNQEI